MRVSVNGYHRDHGSKILVEGDLTAAEVTPYPYCYSNRMVIQSKANDDLGESYVSIIARVQAVMQGTYKLEIRLTLGDVLKLFWIGFKERTFQSIFQVKSNVLQSDTSAATTTATSAAQ
jgi:hypothetical protein